MLNLNGKFKLNGSVCCGDKSVCHRALILASVAQGVSVIRNLSLCADVTATADCLRKLGAKIDVNGTTAVVTPITTPNDNAVLDCKNSGTTARLLAGLVSGLGVSAAFTGDKSLVVRPMDRVIEPLKQMGAKIEKTDVGLFVVKKSRIKGANIQSFVNSAQVKSAVLIAGLFAEGKTTYTEKLPTRNHTELMLRSMGADVKVDGTSVSVAKSVLSPLDFDVPNDPSSVAYPAALGLLTGKTYTCKNVLLNERRTGFYRILRRFGCNVSFDNVKEVCGEKVGDITVRKGGFKPVYATETDVCDAIDEIPLLASMCVAVKGKHVFESVGELRYKECDRIKAIEHIAAVCGQQAFFDGGNLTVISDGKLPQKPAFDSFGDHRIAMCQTVLSLYCGGGSVNDTPFDVSYPNFLNDLGVTPLKLGLIGQNVSNSKSPLLMRCLAEKANVCCSYEAVSLSPEVTDEKLLDVINAFDGLNVTMPFKRRVAVLLNASCEAVNTVGKNVAPQCTDGYGVLQTLQDNGIDVKGKSLWIVGAGGAAEECIRTLLTLNCKMQVINRTAEHAETLKEKYRLADKTDEPYGVLSFIPACKFERSVVLPDSCKFAFTAAYVGESGIERQAKERNLIFIDGLQMLYHQGAKSFSLWTGTEIQRDCDYFYKQIRETK